MSFLSRHRIFLIGLGFLSFVGFSLFATLSSKTKPAMVVSMLHEWNEPEKKLADITIVAVYAVPSDRSGAIHPDWREIITSALEDTVAFHRVTFGDISKLSYEIIPEPVLLTRDHLYYDTDDTNHGNPQALRTVTEELASRYSENIITSTGKKMVLGIIYEGVGAAGGGDSFIISRRFLSDPDYNLIASTLFCHEFAHTMGLPDGYDIESGNPKTEGIMGQGRWQALETTYLEPEFQKNMLSAAR